MCVYICVCVCKRESERERESWEREWERLCVSVFLCLVLFLFLAVFGLKKDFLHEFFFSLSLWMWKRILTTNTSIAASSTLRIWQQGPWQWLPQLQQDFSYEKHDKLNYEYLDNSSFIAKNMDSFGRGQPVGIQCTLKYQCGWYEYPVLRCTFFETNTRLVISENEETKEGG